MSRLGLGGLPKSLISPVSLSREQQQVLDVVLSGQSVFFTGSAGTGKSFLLKRIIGELLLSCYKFSLWQNSLVLSSSFAPYFYRMFSISFYLKLQFSIISSRCVFEAFMRVINNNQSCSDCLHGRCFGSTAHVCHGQYWRCSLSHWRHYTACFCRYKISRKYTRLVCNLQPTKP